MTQKTHSPQKELEHFLDFSMVYGKAYLAAGGPSNRMEDQIAELAYKLNYFAEVFATPTGVFITIHDRTREAQVTSIGRIKETAINLNQLCWLEALLEDITKSKISITAATKILQTSKFKQPIYSGLLRSLASFMMGFMVSLPAFLDTKAAIMSGLITFITFWITGPSLKHIASSLIFRDFMGSLFVYFASLFAALFFKGPFDAYSMGGILFLVPGLTITTAISELAEQNFISGTAKLMKGILTVLSMGIAYMIFQEFAPAAFNQSIIDKVPTPAWISAIGSLCSVFGFSIIFQVPRKALIGSTLTGFCSWVIFRFFQDSNYVTLASFIASTAVGILSLGLGKIFRIPSQTFSVPGVLALLPGLLALTSFKFLASGEGIGGIQTAFKVTMVAGSIVFGLFVARIPFSFAQAAQGRFNFKYGVRKQN